VITPAALATLDRTAPHLYIGYGSTETRIRVTVSDLLPESSR
jgi:hypothetical protein